MNPARDRRTRNPAATPGACCNDGAPARVARVDFRLVWITAVCGGLAASGAVLTALAGDGSAAQRVLGLAVVAGGLYLLPRAVRSARSLSLDIHFLMAIAVAGALVLGEWLEAAAVVFLFALANLLENLSMGRADRCIRALMERAPEWARVLRGGVSVEVPAAEVGLNESMLVRPGERIPLDGRVREGRSAVDQSAVTGEAVPVDRGPGDRVFGGALNQTGSMVVEVTSTSGESTLERIHRYVREAHGRKPPIQRFVDRFARVYTPVVFLLSAAAAVGPPLLLDEAFPTWIYRGLVLLVISCPCAFVISTPITVVSGLAAAARGGVLIKGGTFLEEASSLEILAWDKTGTLTRGRPRLREVIPLNGDCGDRLLSLGAALASGTNHPLGRAIVEEAERRNLPFARCADYRDLPGAGGEGRVGGRTIRMGSAALFGDLAIQPDAGVSNLLARLGGRGRSIVLVGDERAVLGILGFDDELRPEAATALEELRRAGYDRHLVLTGDSPRSARALEEALGLQVRAALLPEDKTRVVRELRSAHGKVGMVGDGINDAPALAEADLGIAMGTGGSDVALESADIALVGDDLGRLPFTLRLSRRAVRIIRQNVTIALALKAVFLGLAAAGLATLWMAVLADMGATLLVVFNALRVLRVR
jgi:Cd2+/Zn2+-exporting ATPase